MTTTPRRATDLASVPGGRGSLISAISSLLFERPDNGGRCQERLASRGGA